MTNTTVKLPFYARAGLFFMGLYGFVYLMYAGRSIIIPIVYAVIIAILVNPLVGYLETKKVNKIVAITIAIGFVFLFFFMIAYIISAQIGMLSDIYPKITAKFTTTTAQLMQWVSTRFSLKPTQINNWISDTEKTALNNLSIGEQLTTAGQIIITLMLIPVYLFMILIYKPLLLEFVKRLFATEHHNTIADILLSVKTIIHGYLKGLFLEILIIATLNSIALMLLGVKYAVILGLTGAIVNIIPYIGGIISIALPMLMAYVTSDSPWAPLFVFGAYMVIQFIDNHYVMPRIVASRVQINALVSVVVVLVGGTIWGIPGMFVAIPLTAIVKVIFDHIKPLKPYGFLLGDSVPHQSPSFFRIKAPRKNANRTLAIPQTEEV